MRTFIRPAVRILGALALAVALAPAARADFEIIVTEGGGPALPAIVDNQPGDLNPAIGAITVDPALINPLLTNFTFSDLSAESNRTTGTPFSNDAATLSQTGTVLRSGNLTGSFSITITAFDTDYNFPMGNPKTMTTSASDTFRFTTAGDSRTFQSFFDNTNSTPPGPGLASPLLAFVPPTGTGPFSTSNPGVDTPLGTQPIPFGISNTTVITLGSSASAQSAQRDQFTGATTITAVPEPASVGLVALGLGLLAVGRARRRTRVA